ncbi:MAG: histone deacetylase [Candidatus Latescibacterota bacterium]|nr:MAG: histone deacetylase [Candidatus Latescibacterota bacterium]
MPRVVHSPRYECDIGPHVFPVEKFRLTMERLVAEAVVTPAQVLEPQPPERHVLELAHTPTYLDDFLNLRQTMSVLLSELPISAPIRDAYLLATGGTLLAARCALEEGCAMHVGGGYHHAMADHAEGFCYLNDIAVALRALQQEGLLQRAAVIDTDVHQGNGTARIFCDDPSVFTFSIHQENNYPVKERSDLDIGLPDHADDALYLERLSAAIPLVLEQAPDLVMMVAGADPYEYDQLGGLRLTIDGLQRRDHMVVRACAARGVPVVGLTAGGYAQQLEDTVTIHANTAREVLAWNAERDAAGS